MKLNQRQLELMREAGINVPEGAKDDSFLTAEDYFALGDFLIENLGPGQEMTPKAREAEELLSYLADRL